MLPGFLFLKLTLQLTKDFHFDRKKLFAALFKAVVIECMRIDYLIFGEISY